MFIVGFLFDHSAVSVQEMQVKRDNEDTKSKIGQNKNVSHQEDK